MSWIFTITSEVFYVFSVWVLVWMVFNKGLKLIREKIVLQFEKKMHESQGLPNTSSKHSWNTLRIVGKHFNNHLIPYLDCKVNSICAVHVINTMCRQNGLIVSIRRLYFFDVVLMLDVVRTMSGHANIVISGLCPPAIQYYSTNRKTARWYKTVMLLVTTNAFILH